MEFQRILQLANITSKKSFFLFGPRGTGKSFLIRKCFGPKTPVINLLRASIQLRLIQNPSLLEEMIDETLTEKKNLIVIDEIQKVPLLLDEVHRLIEERGLKFLLTGSSARRLKNDGANLLAGRAWVAELFPLVFPEIANFNLDRYLRYGGLPAVVLSEEPEEQLDAYVQTYINEEIKSESLVRRIPAFVEFLRFAALSNTKLINFASLARDAGVSPPTIASYVSILEDTLIGFQIRPWKKPTSRKPIAASKFYFFDTGVVNTLAGTQYVDRNSNLYGELFEQWIAMELRAYLSYRRLKHSLLFWRTEDGLEVDFIIPDKVAIEVKSTRKVSSSDLKSLTILKNENKLACDFYLVSHDPVDRTVDGVHVLNWKTFISRLWQDQIISSKPLIST